MSVTTTITYAAALVVAVASPGLATFAVISTGLSRGVAAATATSPGIAIGDVLLVLIALLGLGAIAAAGEWAFTVVKLAGTAYLGWLGIKMWRAEANLDVIQAGHPLRSLGIGLAVAVCNPKAILFHASLMPVLIDLNAVSLAEGLAILAIVFAANFLTLALYGLLSGQTADWFRGPGRMKWMNRCAGGALIGAAILVACR